METAAKNNDMEKARNIFETLETKFDRFCREAGKKRTSNIERPTSNGE